MKSQRLGNGHFNMVLEDKAYQKIINQNHDDDQYYKKLYYQPIIAQTDGLPQLCQTASAKLPHAMAYLKIFDGSQGVSTIRESLAQMFRTWDA